VDREKPRLWRIAGQSTILECALAEKLRLYSLAYKVRKRATAALANGLETGKNGAAISMSESATESELVLYQTNDGKTRGRRLKAKR